MFKTIRAAGYAAAAAFLCTANSAAAQDVQPSPAAPSIAAAPADAEAPAPLGAVLPAAPAPAPAPVVEQSKAEPAVVPVRIRPDRQEAPAAAAPAPRAEVGVSGAAAGSLEDLVAQHANAAIADEQFECLASAVYFESRGEPLAGQLAVAEVILNRVKSGRFRSTICDVVKQPSQFSFVRRGVIPAAKRESAAWARAVAIAHIALNELHDVTGENSLFFHATYVNPGWGRPARRIARIGNHIFYR